MIFSSIDFLLLFLPIFLLVYRFAPESARNGVLLAGSLIFYAMGEPRYLLLFMGSMTLNYFVGLHLGQGSRMKGKNRKQKINKYNIRRRKLFFVSVAVNVSILAFCKLKAGEGGLPLGISFYTFQMLSYLIDVYTGDQRRETSYVQFATYIAMFPKLISGPIADYGEVREQLRGRGFTVDGLQNGLKVFTMGLAAKVLLADRLGFLWREVQVTGFESISTPLAWLAAIAFSMKIYFDFCGYSLMAVGLGRMLGFELPENFRRPYMAGSVREFYRRWHITLGRWFRRYVYIPLGGNRKGELRTILNLGTVWLLTSVWHGRTVNFLIWGMLIWVIIVLERQLDRLGIGKLFGKGVLRIIPRLYVWAVIPVTWICFSVTEFSQLQVYLGRMFGIFEGCRVSAGDWSRALQSYWYLFAIGALSCTPIPKALFDRWKDNIFFSLLLAALFWACVWRLQVEGNNPFMYFKF